MDLVVQIAQPAPQFLAHLRVERAEGSSSSNTRGSMASARASARAGAVRPIADADGDP